MSRRASRSAPVLATAALLLTLTGCALAHPGSLQWRVDKRLHFLSPAARAKVGQPVTITWRMDNFHIAPLGSGPSSKNTGYFAIFIDRSPMKPGKSLNAINKHDAACVDAAVCTTKDYLARKQVYTTTKDEFTVQDVSDILSNKLSTQFHTATLVLLNTAGLRIGESAWTIEFRMHASGAND